MAAKCGVTASGAGMNRSHCEPFHLRMPVMRPEFTRHIFRMAEEVHFRMAVEAHFGRICRMRDQRPVASHSARYTLKLASARLEKTIDD